MARIITWFKQHQYQWERGDFRKVSERLMWGALIFAVCLLGSILLMAKLETEEAIVVAVAMAVYAIVVACATCSFAIQWADRKLKG